MEKLELIVVKPNETREEIYQKFLNHLYKLGIRISEEGDDEKS